MHIEKKKCLKVAITGAMGCGKSAAAQTFRNLGVQVLDADKLCHEALESDACVRKAVCDILGKDCFDVETGIVRRDIIAKRVFGDSELLGELEKILHPAAEKMWEKKSARNGRIRLWARRFFAYNCSRSPFIVRKKS